MLLPALPVEIVKISFATVAEVTTVLNVAVFTTVAVDVVPFTAIVPAGV